ncbi:hypothetical protein J6590_074087 [Homalodisca vitripennis]|nr:hypothetical protein J6590_074087 [Homalodisca vitripennis]
MGRQYSTFPGTCMTSCLVLLALWSDIAWVILTNLEFMLLIYRSVSDFATHSGIHRFRQEVISNFRNEVSLLEYVNNQT